MKPIDFWFSIGSTYTYLTVMRLPALAREQGLTLNWRPFNVRTILVEESRSRPPICGATSPAARGNTHCR